MSAGPTASRRSRVAPFIVMEVLEQANARARSGAEVLHLEVGEPGVPLPERARAAVERTLCDAPLGYSEALGLGALRERIARAYRENYDLEVAPERIVLTVGASGGFLLAFLAAFDAGDRVALAEPGYPAYRNILRALDLEPVAIAAGIEDKFQPTPETLQRAGPIRGLILASPANPTGSMLDPEALGAIAAWCRRHGVWLISDEIYHGITYERPAQTALAYDCDVLVINSFSKYFGLTGWRLGWMVVPERLLEPVARLAQNLFIAPPTISQYAALALYDARDALDLRVAAYRRNRDRLLAALREAGVERLSPPEGAFYLYADITPFGADSVRLCRDMLEDIGVAATPGIDFDPERGHRYVRFSFAAEARVIDAACARLVPWLRRRRGSG